MRKSREVFFAAFVFHELVVIQRSALVAGKHSDPVAAVLLRLVKERVDVAQLVGGITCQG